MSDFFQFSNCCYFCKDQKGRIVSAAGKAPGKDAIAKLALNGRHIQTGCTSFIKVAAQRKKKRKLVTQTCPIKEQMLAIKKVHALFKQTNTQVSKYTKPFIIEGLRL